MALWRINKKLGNDIHLSVSFLMLYTAINTQSHILKTLTVSIHEDNPKYLVDGYTCFGILYSTTAFICWLTPCIFVMIGSRTALILGFLCNVPFIFACYSENATFTYISTVISGFGAAILWVGQSNYIVQNSEVGKVYDGISCFWLFYKMSFLLGDAIVFFEFSNPGEPIDRTMRARITIILLCFVAVALILISVLRAPIRAEQREGKSYNLPMEIKLAYSIFSLRTFVVLAVIYTFIGINITYMSVVGASMGFSEYLSINSRKYAPLSGVLQGIGEISGALLAMYLKNKKYFKGKLMIVGCVSNLTAYILTFLTLPSDSSFTYTHALPIIQLPITFLFLANILIGLGDACVQIEIYHCIGVLFPNDSVSAFGVLYFFWAMGTAVSYFYSATIGLYFQLLLLVLLSSTTWILYYSSQAILLRSDEREELILYASQMPQYNAEQISNKSDNVETADGVSNQFIISHHL